MSKVRSALWIARILTGGILLIITERLRRAADRLLDCCGYEEEDGAD